MSSRGHSFLINLYHLALYFHIGCKPTTLQKNFLKFTLWFLIHCFSCWLKCFLKCFYSKNRNKLQWSALWWFDWWDKLPAFVSASGWEMRPGNLVGFLYSVCAKGQRSWWCDSTSEMMNQQGLIWSWLVCDNNMTILWPNLIINLFFSEFRYFFFLGF